MDEKKEGGRKEKRKKGLMSLPSLLKTALIPSLGIRTSIDTVISP